MDASAELSGASDRNVLWVRLTADGHSEESEVLLTTCEISRVWDSLISTSWSKTISTFYEMISSTFACPCKTIYLKYHLFLCITNTSNKRYALNNIDNTIFWQNWKLLKELINVSLLTDLGRKMSLKHVTFLVKAYVTHANVC